MTIDKKEIQTWIDALRSGKYKQTMGELQNENGFCCLGVACHLFIPTDKLTLTDDGIISGYIPRDQAFSPMWLDAIDEDFKSVTGTRLQNLNDDGIRTTLAPEMDDCLDPFSFDEIADLIQAVYVEEVLK